VSYNDCAVPHSTFKCSAQSSVSLTVANKPHCCITVRKPVVAAHSSSREAATPAVVAAVYKITMLCALYVHCSLKTALLLLLLLSLLVAVYKCYCSSCSLVAESAAYKQRCALRTVFAAAAAYCSTQSVQHHATAQHSALHCASHSHDQMPAATLVVL
jgi:hypothetical protein